MAHYSDEQIADLILRDYAGRKIAFLAPVVRERKGHYRELFDSFLRKGYIYARIDGVIRDFTGGEQLDRYKTHSPATLKRLVIMNFKQ